MLDALTILPFALLLAAVLGLWIHRFAWMAALVSSIGAGYHTGALHGPAALWIAIAAMLAIAYRLARSRAQAARPGRSLQLVAGLAFFIYGVAMGLALLPGFVRVELVAAQVLSPGAEPYALAVGFPKVVIGILVLGLVNPDLLGRSQWGPALARAAPIYLFTTVVSLACVYALGYTRFAPHWSSLFLLWAPVNLFFTCLSEEAFFRGFVQQELSQARRAYFTALTALVVAAALFGLAHAGGGASYVLIATVAGLGYGWALLRTRRIEAAMAVHFGLNATHFLLFVYPRLAP